MLILLPGKYVNIDYKLYVFLTNKQIVPGDSLNISFLIFIYFALANWNRTGCMSMAHLLQCARSYSLLFRISISLP